MALIFEKEGRKVMLQFCCFSKTHRMNLFLQMVTTKLNRAQASASYDDPPPLKWPAPIVRKRRIEYGNQATQT